MHVIDYVYDSAYSAMAMYGYASRGGQEVSGACDVVAAQYVYQHSVFLLKMEYPLQPSYTSTGDIDGESSEACPGEYYSERGVIKRIWGVAYSWSLRWIIGGADIHVAAATHTGNGWEARLSW